MSETKSADTDESPAKYVIAPDRSKTVRQNPWEGNCKRKPWDYRITAVIPVLDTFDTLEIAIELLRLQSVRPFIMIVDTGSTDNNLEKICSLRAEDVEVHSLRLNGTQHPSDFPAMAMDVAFALCRTNFLFATHADVFLRRRDMLEDWLEMTKKLSPVVGYELSERAHTDWKGMVSHTATMYHMPTMDRIGFGWSLRRLSSMMGVKDYKPDPMRPNWPDTEILGNYILRYHKIKPHIIGAEKNFERQVDDNIDHCRSVTSGRLYSPVYAQAANAWVEDAIKQAKDRIREWETFPVTDN